MRRCLLILLPLAIVVGIGCGSKEKEEEAAAQETPATEVAAQPETTTAVAAPPETALRVEPAPQPAPTVQRDERGRYTVQVSSWRTRRKAEAQAELLRREGYDAYVQRAVLDNGETWYRVRVGAFATVEEARQFAATLSDQLESGYWVDRLRGEQ
jgi:cell division protein FtsN